MAGLAARAPSRGATDLRRAVLSVLAALGLAASTTVDGQEPGEARAPRFTGDLSVTVARVNLVALGPDGQPVADLRPDELEVWEDGAPVEVLALEPAVAAGPAQPVAGSGEAQTGTPWRVVLYVSTRLTGRFQLPLLLRRAAAEADRLVAMGTVDVVLADPDPWLVVEGAGQVEPVRRALEAMADQKLGLMSLERIRRRFVHELEPGVGFLDRGSYMASEEGVTRARLTMTAARARAAAREETLMVRGDLDRLAAWVEGQPSTKRGLLLWMTGGFDVRPADFYLQYIGQVDQQLARMMRLEEAGARTLEPDLRRVVELALAAGWTIVPLNSAAPEAFLFGADVDGTSKVQHFNGVSPSQIDTQEHDFEMENPVYPLRLAAEATGGELVRSGDELAGAIGRVGSAYLLSYQVARPRDGTLHRLTVRCLRPEVSTRAQSAVPAGTPEGLAAERGRQLLAGEGERGELPSQLRLLHFRPGRGETRQGEVEVGVALATARSLLPDPGLARLRLTLVVDLADEAPFVHHRELPFPAAEQEPWLHAFPVRVPPAARAVAVVVEELATGLWGAATAPIPPP